MHPAPEIEYTRTYSHASSGLAAHAPQPSVIPVEGKRQKLIRRIKND